VDVDHGQASRSRPEVTGDDRGVADLDRRARRPPRTPSTVEHAYVGMAVMAQQPPTPCCGEARPVVEHHDRAVAPYACGAHSGREDLRLRQRMPTALAGRPGQRRVEIDVRGTRDVP